MAQTLSQALDSFYLRLKNAVESNSKRKIESMMEDATRINGYMTLYIQASGEGDTVTANEAIQGIKDILGGVITSDALPNFAVNKPSRNGVLQVSAANQKINFSSTLGSTNYSLQIQTYDMSGYQTLHERGAKEEDGFYITISVAGYIDYKAELI